MKTAEKSKKDRGGGDRGGFEIGSQYDCGTLHIVPPNKIGRVTGLCNAYPGRTNATVMGGSTVCGNAAEVPLPSSALP